MEKTGIACPHLLLAAYSNEDKNYGELIANRWRKERLAMEIERPRMWVPRLLPPSKRKDVETKSPPSKGKSKLKRHRKARAR